MQSQTDSPDHAWGTRAKDAKQVYEAGELAATFFIDGKKLDPLSGTRDLPDGTLAVSYPLAKGGQKMIVFKEDQIEVRVDHPGEFEEHVPTLVVAPADTPAIDLELPDRLTPQKLLGPTVTATTHVVTHVIPATGSLTYRLRPAQASAK
jgi:hypothetical protein